MASASWLILREELAVVVGRHIGPDSWLGYGRGRRHPSPISANLIANPSLQPTPLKRRVSLNMRQFAGKLSHVCVSRTPRDAAPTMRP